MSLFKKKKIVTAQPDSHLRDVCRNFVRNRIALAALIVLTAIVLLAIFADVIADYNAVALKQDPKVRLQTASAEHWLGTDNYGRDLFARIIHGARYSLIFGVGCTALSLSIGCVLGATTAYYDHPRHPYTKFLLAATPKLDPRQNTDDEELLTGELPSPIHPPSGCRFRTRCPYATQICADEAPALQGDGHLLACHHPL